MAGYFTILTNALVAAHMLLVALHWRISAARAAGLLLSIVMVGLVYHTLLARLWQPDGLLAWADLGLHTGVPLAYALLVAEHLRAWLGHKRSGVLERSP